MALTDPLTARELITDALDLIGVSQLGEPLSGAQGEKGLKTLNRLLDGFSNDELVLFQKRQNTLSLTSGTQTYYIGKGGDVNETTGTAQAGASTTITAASGEIDFDDQYKGFEIVTTGGTGSGQRRTIQSSISSTDIITVVSAWDTNPDNTTTYKIEAKRPQRIESAYTRDSGNNDVIIGMVDNDQWSRIYKKDIQSQYPLFLYYRADFPRGQINLCPKPGSGLTLYLESWDQLTRFTTLDTEASFPPGYDEMLIYNLARRWAPSFGRTLDPEIRQTAIDTMAAIKTTNLDIPPLRNDLPHLSGQHGENYRERFFAGY